MGPHYCRSSSCCQVYLLAIDRQISLTHPADLYQPWISFLDPSNLPIAAILAQLIYRLLMVRYRGSALCQIGHRRKKVTQKNTAPSPGSTGLATSYDHRYYFLWPRTTSRSAGESQ